MKVLGLLGGMSWESTATYHQVINRRVREQLGGFHSSPCIIYSFNFAEIERLQQAGKWDEAGSLLGKAAADLGKIGADAIVLCTNTMHKVADAIEEKSGIPLLHIADYTAERIKKAGFRKVGLIGTRFTMVEDFYKSRLMQNHELEAIIPNESDIDIVHNIIYYELCSGIIKEDSRAEYTRIVDELVKAGAECVILGCTEIGHLLQPEHVRIPLFDTTVIHAEAAADWAIFSSKTTSPDKPALVDPLELALEGKSN